MVFQRLVAYKMNVGLWIQLLASCHEFLNEGIILLTPYPLLAQSQIQVIIEKILILHRLD
jgi:hypothetical protein